MVIQVVDPGDVNIVVDSPDTRYWSVRKVITWITQRQRVCYEECARHDYVRMRQFVQQVRAAADHREAVMNLWWNSKFEYVLLVYMFAWAVALGVTYLLTE